MLNKDKEALKAFFKENVKLNDLRIDALQD